VLHSVSKDAEAEVSIVVELVLDFSIQPTVFRLAPHQGRGKIPVVQSEEGGNPSFQELVNDVIVEGNTSPVNIIQSTFWKDSGPRNRHSEVLDTEFFHHLDVAFILVVEVISHISSVIIMNSAWNSDEIIPDSHSFSIDVIGTLDLVGSSSHSPSKVIWVNIESARYKVLPEFGDIFFWVHKMVSLFFFVREQWVSFLGDVFKGIVLSESLLNNVRKAAHHAEDRGDLGLPGKVAA